ncbi:MAG TPA: glycosyltransferase family 4 protein, partial [Kofleriaceae bacterium]|nr:glycosyltransferase family 4 protein [Kofleriaceae bacterium]
MARILISGFCAVPGPTRSGVQLRQVVRALSGRHTVDLLAVREGDQAYVERQGTGRLLRVPTHDADLATQVQAFQRALRRQLEGADYDVVHCRDGWSARPVLEGRDRFGYAVVYDLTRAPMAERDDLGPELAAAHDRDEESLLVGADLVLVPTEPARRFAIGRGAPDRVMVAPPGVDVDRFDWDVWPPDAPPVVLYAGTLAPGRGVRLLLQAMAEVVRTLHARLLLVGPIAPGFDASLRSAIKELGLAGKVDVKGPIDHDLMPALIGRATVCVAPSAVDLPRRPYALYPTKLLEYLACRRAVLAPRRGAVTALVDHGREGLLFQPGDAADLARKLVRLLEDRSLRERLAATGYERVRREFTASAARRAITAAYARLASRAEWAPRFVEVQTGESVVTPPPAATSADDDFEATVFETSPPAPGSGTGPIEPATGPIELADADAVLVGDS